jgi:hypothetical protein
MLRLLTSWVVKGHSELGCQRGGEAIGVSLMLNLSLARILRRDISLAKGQRWTLQC